MAKEVGARLGQRQILFG
nr:hypothetical protein [Deinococcus sp. AJ005]